MAWTVDDSHKVDIGEEVPEYPIADIVDLDVDLYSSTFILTTKLHNSGDVTDYLYWFTYDVDRGKVLHGPIPMYLDPCQTGKNSKRIEYNFPNSEWRLAVMAGHEEDGKLVIDDTVGFKLTK